MFKKVKKRLATISKGGIRYRFVKGIFGEERINDSKACTFYWVLMPGSVLMYLVVGIVAIIYTTIASPIGFFFGYTPRLFEKFEKSSSETPNNDGGLFYPYRYSPLRGKYKKLVLWQYVIIIFFVYVLMKVVSRGTYGVISSPSIDIIKYFGHWVSHNRYWIGFALSVILAIYTLGRLVYSYRYELGEFWDANCPKLEVVEDQKKEK